MTRIALGIQYTGTQYHGWQRQAQPNVSTIQVCVENALNCIAPQSMPIQITCAGRTDRGVHAVGQVVHFDTQVVRSQQAWVLGTNTHLPSDIAVIWAKECENDFHARYSALARCYRYILYNQPIRSALWAEKTTWYQRPLNIAAMQVAAKLLLGEHDFSSFRAANCQSRSAHRCIHFIHIEQQTPFIMIDIQANAFLHHMVRNIVGVLLDIGCEKLPPNAMGQILAARDRKQASLTAPAQGLYLLSVTYPQQYQLPVATNHFINAAF